MSRLMATLDTVAPGAGILERLGLERFGIRASLAHGNLCERGRMRLETEQLFQAMNEFLQRVIGRRSDTQH